jgi:nicotinamide-nucleotide amidase
MAAINERQAEILEGAEVLENPVGTAPGQWLSEGEAFVALLPGPPHELRAVFESRVLPRLKGLGPARLLRKRSLTLQGLPESEVDSRIAPIYKTYPEIRTTILAARGCISVHLQQWTGPEEKPAGLEELWGRIAAEVGEWVFTTADEPLEEVVGRLLRESGRTIAVAESCTAGMISSMLTKIPGSSDYFLGGVVCYGNDLKVDLCRVPRELLVQHGAVSAEVAEVLARGVRETAGSAVGLSVTGIAGPGGGSEQKPVGLVYIGLADGRRCEHTRRVFTGDRETVRELTASAALGRLRRFLHSSETAG